MMTRRSSRIAVAVVAATLIGTSCSGDDGGSDSSDATAVDSTVDGHGSSTSDSGLGGGVGDSFRRYQSFGDCEAFLDWTKEQMLDRVTPYGLDGWSPYYYDEDGRVAVPVEAPAATEAPAGEDTASTGDGEGGTSSTNTQEVGVDEGDVTETDGRYVFSVIDDTLRSVDLKEQSLLYEKAVPDGDHQMILSGDRLLLVTQSSSSGAPDTVVAVYDVRDGVPQLTENRHLEGWVLATRAVDGTARIVLRSGITDRIDFVYPISGTDDAEEKALEMNEQAIEDLQPEDLLPRTFTVGAHGEQGPMRLALDCDEMGTPGDFSGFGLTWVATLDMNGDSDVDGTSGLVADAQTVYASTSGLYVATQRWEDNSGDVAPVHPEPPHTDIHMFDLSDPDGSAYLASGPVAGTLLNQYSLSEHDDHLRVATTTNDWGFGGEQASGVHVLERDGQDLVEVGAVTGLGQGEQIQAVRFLGDRGYVVTFRQVDPLFVLDLSDPTHPKMEGELKVPGYSTYLHPIDRDRLLGIGYDGTDTGQITGTQLSLFDVSDPATPRLLDTLDIGQTSEATFDPHAFLWWEDTGTVVVPRELVCDGPFATGSATPDTQGCESAVVAQVQGDDLVEQGRIFQWFPIRRSLVASGDLVTVSAGGVLVSDLTTLAELADVRFDIPNTDAEDDLP